jgi:putative salt-induced outer membrane protein
MPREKIRFSSLVWAIVLSFLCWTPPALSAPAGLLSNAQSAAIRGAAARGDQGAMYALIFSAISQNPEQTAGIVGEAVSLVPEHRDAILSTVGAAFPAEAGRFAGVSAAAPATSATAAVPVPAPVTPAEPETAATGPDPAAVATSEAAPTAEVGDAALETAEAAATADMPAEPLPLWSGEGELGAAHNSGNTKNDSIRAAGKLAWAPGQWENEARVTYTFFNDSGQTTERRLVASAGPRYNITDRFFAWGNVRYVDDKNDGFQWTLTESAGPGYRVFNRDDLKLTVSAGPGLQQTREKQDDGGDLKNEAVAVGIVDFEWTFVENATLSNRFGVTSGAERTRLDNLSALTLKIYGDLAARLSYEVRHDTSPGADKKKTDTTGLASIVYSFESN